MNKDIRVTVAEDLVASIKKDPSLSNIIMTSPRFFSRWERLILDMFHLENINVLRSHLNTITIEGNENKHQPTVSLVACPGRDIIGRRVTGVCVLDLHFFKETKSIIDSFDGIAKALERDDKWFEKNTPLSLYVKYAIRPALMGEAGLWGVGDNYPLTASVLQDIFPKVVMY